MQGGPRRGLLMTVNTLQCAALQAGSSCLKVSSLSPARHISLSPTMKSITIIPRASVSAPPSSILHSVINIILRFNSSSTFWIFTRKMVLYILHHGLQSLCFGFGMRIPNLSQGLKWHYRRVDRKDWRLTNINQRWLGYPTWENNQTVTGSN